MRIIAIFTGNAKGAVLRIIPTCNGMISLFKCMSCRTFRFRSFGKKLLRWDG
jgi:hypothetical protein